MTEFPSLPAASLHPKVETAQRFLGAAYDSVESVLEWFDSASELAAEDAMHVSAELGQRTTYSAESMLRSMLVFAGAGLDAVIKQLVRDALPDLVRTSETARDKYLVFVERRLDASVPGASRTLAKLLTSGDPQQALVESYVDHLTGSSLQSVNQLEVTAAALGLSDRQLRRDIKDLAPVFLARNEIIHELDLLDPERHGDQERRTRKVEDVVAYCHSALTVGQDMVNAVARMLESERDSAVRPLPQKTGDAGADLA